MSQGSNAKHLQSLGSSETTYQYDEPSYEQLETFEYINKGITQLVGFKTDEFTSLCPKTGQPDFANIDIVYLPKDLGVESKSLKLYLFAYRNHGSFHEDCMSKIASDLVKVLDPYYLRVVGDFTRRGGIAIKPISEYISDVASRPTELLAQYDSYHFLR